MTLAGVAILVACTAGQFVDRGQRALDAHDLPGAEAAYRRALARDPTRADALAGLGWTYHLAGRTDAARGAFEQCAAVAPQDPECLRGQASTVAAGGDPARARELLTRALQLDPYDPGANSSLALLDLTTGELEAARDRYESLVRRFPAQAEYKLGLAEVRYQERDYEGCLTLVEEALEVRDAPARYRAMLFVLQARALVAATAGREDAARCAETAPPVRAWLDAADQALEAAQATGVGLPALPETRRLVLRRRAMVDEACPVPVPAAAAE